MQHSLEQVRLVFTMLLVFNESAVSSNTAGSNWQHWCHRRTGLCETERSTQNTMRTVLCGLFK